MRMRILSAVIIMILSVCMLAVSVSAEDEIASGTCGENVTWKLSTNGVMTISGTGDMSSDYTEHTQRPYYDHIYSIKKVVIEPGITSVGKYAFKDCTNLYSVYLPQSVTSIGQDAFRNTNLASAIIPDSLKIIEDHAFADCSILTSVKIPGSVTSIASDAFGNCSTLLSVTFEPGAAGFSPYMFSGCSSLQNVYFLGDAPEQFVSDAFGETVDENITIYYYSGTQNWDTFEYEGKKPTEIAIQSSGACGASDSDSVIWILYEDGFLRISGSGAICDYTADTSAPWDNTLVNNVLIENGITSLGDYMFAGCTNLASVGIPDSVTQIGTYAFSGCADLSSVYISDNVQQIKQNAFESCSALSVVVIPGTVSSIENLAFMNCSKLNSVYFMGDAPEMTTDYVFYNPSSDLTIYYYEGTANWETVSSSNCTIIELPRPADYTAILSASSSTVTLNETVTITVTANKPFSAAELSLTYDNQALTFDTSASSLNGISVTAKDGIVMLADFGTPKSAYTLIFTAVKPGTTAVNLSSAAFSEAEDAASKDLTTAAITTGSVSVTVNPTVTLSDLFEGDSIAEYDRDYTFRVCDTNAAHYIYTISATMDGNTVSVINNEDGSYTIKQVTGILDIRAERTAREYNITFMTTTDTVLPSDTTAAYGIPFSFDIPSEDGYTTAITSITYQEEPKTVEYSITNNSVTIPGTAIIDHINVVIDRTWIPINVSVTVNGDVGDITDFTNSAILEQPYTLTVIEDPRYIYSVTATVNGTDVTVTGENGSYTIAGEHVTGDIEFTITKTLALNIESSHYLTLDNNTSLWLITHQTTYSADLVYTYEGTAMYWSEPYQAYCTLVASETAPDTAVEKFALTTGTSVSVDYGKDVNMSGKLDANDAQFVYNMYNTMYSGITDEVTVEKYLRADINGDKEITTADAAAIINQILNIQ